MALCSSILFYSTLLKEICIYVIILMKVKVKRRKIENTVQLFMKFSTHLRKNFVTLSNYIS